MDIAFQSKFFFIGALFIAIKGSSITSGKFATKNDETNTKSMPVCSGFPTGLSYQSSLVIGWEDRWENQCSTGQMTKGIWSPSENGTIQDMKCCSGPVDQVLSEMLFGLENKDGGPKGVNQTWNAQCSGNHVVTGVKLVGDSKNNAVVAGLKCSAVIDMQIDYTSCSRLEPGKNSGNTRDPVLPWAEQCVENEGLVGVYSENRFTSIKYGRCCSITEVKNLNVLPMSCYFKPSNMCGWSLSRNSILSWTFHQRNKDVYSLWLDPGKPSGSATITSPAYSFARSTICLRLKYQLIWHAAIYVYIKSYKRRDGVAIIKRVATLTQNRPMFTDQDVLIDVSSNFQIIFEGRRFKFHWSNVMIQSIGFLESSKCQVDQCTQSSDCDKSEDCLPSGLNGFKKCNCKLGYERRNGVCQVKLSSTESPMTTENRTVKTSTGGQGRGGDAVTDKITPRLIRKRKAETEERIEPWMYTVIGSICGTLLVVFLVFSFLTFRKTRLNRRMYQFNFDMNYLRARSIGGSLISDNNNSYVLEPTIQETQMQDPIDDCGQWSIPRIEVPREDASIKTGTPPSHHYFEVEPETDLERKTSQVTLVSPLYGSLEDVSDFCDEKEVFLEPPNDEKELCAQLDREIDLKQLTILHEKQLGQGAFGYVHYGIWRTSDGSCKGVAIKSMKDSNSAEERIKFLQEAAIMKQFAHQNVVFMFGVVTKRYPPIIVLEYMKNGNLRKYLRRQRKERTKSCMQLTDSELQHRFLKMAREITAGMTYLSGMQFVHRDLAARNILLDDNMICKIGDFGLARDLLGCNHYISQGGQIPVKWTAPEALSFRRYSSASDVWSFGVLLYEIWSVGNKPYEMWSNDEVIEKVCNNGYRLPPPSDCPRVIYHLMIDCWHPEESKRPRFSQIKFCLAQKDERLLGRQKETRQRSVTLNEISCQSIKEDQYGELQYTYCKTD